MNREPAGPVLLAGGLIGLGVLGLAFREHVLWEALPDHVPARGVLAALSGVLLLAIGAGLLTPRFKDRAAQAAFGYLVLCTALLKLPPLVTGPLVEVNWLGLGMFGTVALAAWLLAAPGGRRTVRVLYGLALIPIGISHFTYAQAALDLVPTWLPARVFWADLAGAGHLAAGLGVLFGVFPRVAATMEAGMITLFTLLVWIPGVIGHPAEHFQWSELAASWTVGAAAWVVAESYAGARWLAVAEPALSDAA